MLPPTARPQRLESVMGKDLGDEYMFYDSEGERVHVLNGVAREIYLLCDGRRSVADVVEDIVNRYEVDRETAHRDVVELLQSLTDLRLVAVA